MARYSQDESPPPGWTPTQAVPEPVINNPYDEPHQHWSYKDGVPQLVPARRPAMYWYKSKKLAGGQSDLFAEEERDPLPLVNRLREDVKRWRDSDYRGASSVTKDLLRHWSRKDLVRPLFFCQREATETLIYLLELAIPGRLASTGFRNFQVDSKNLKSLLVGELPNFEEISGDFYPRLIDPAAEPDLLPLRRLGCKMATGSGKTVIMAMLIAWAFCNRGRNPGTRLYPSGVLICAPNLTVKKRLQVLRPEDPDNYFDEFDIVPSKYRELLGAGRIHITNWHGFAPKSEHSEGGTSYKVVQKGEETPEAFARDRLGELASRLPILVLNDEGHHCWRPNPDKKVEQLEKEAEKGKTKEEKDALKEELEEARVWLAGLDKINSAGLLGEDEPCISAAVDLSATPFYLSNSGFPEGSPFPWIVSDFGLVDAIECGIVKVPRLPVRDDSSSKDEAGRPNPKYYRLWESIKESLKPVDKVGKRPKPDSVFREAGGALKTLAGQWQTRFEEIRDKSADDNPVPPVLIVVCDNTNIAQVFFEKISGEREVEVPSEDGKKTEKKTVYGGTGIGFPLLENDERHRRTVRIDTKLLAKIETEGDQTKDEAALALREIIDTVGKKGQAGEHVRCVVSVSMLTEGWDASNVTHVLGVRAFGSQLLCEQVVGRGLRRMSYVPDSETGLLPAEYVDVYGIPFSLIPFKGKAKDVDRPDPVYHHIYALSERSEFELRMPVVESYTYGLRGSGIRCDVDSLEGFVVDKEPTEVYLVATRGYHDEADALQSDEFVRQTREVYYKNIRFQQIVYKLAQMIVDDLIQGAEESDSERAKRGLLARHQLFPEIVAIIQSYVKKKVRFATGVNKKELGLQKYAELLAKRVRDGILPAVAAEEAPLLPVVNSFKPFVTTAEVSYRTTRPVERLTKSHLNLAMVQSGKGKKPKGDALDEVRTIQILEDMDCVEYYTPNDRNVGLAVPYEYQGQPHQYEPDFVVKLRGGKQLMLESKGGGGETWEPDRVLAKNAAAKKWVAAVNNSRRYGEWAFEICRAATELRAVLSKHSDGDVVLPFTHVEPKPEERFSICVPLTTLRAAAGSWSEEQASLDPAEWADEWITWETSTKFEPGMFVAKVLGDSMEPEVPNGSYCLFREPGAGTRQGKRLLVWHSGIDDPHTGGQYTLKVYSSEKTADAETGWQHTRITLKPLNAEYPPIVLTPKEEQDVRVIAEFVEVVG
ncbi:MAG: DEAD/DEAH box helicase family protein [bacterium]|nr:DEAD/DEAH box helicase family protein [bacterium]